MVGARRPFVKVSNHNLVRSGKRGSACRSVPVRLGGRFRKACRPCFSTHSSGVQWHRKTPRTCLEGPFGEVLRATGQMAKANPFGFSTKYQDDETDLLYYGYSYYNASMGRLLSKDILEELAFDGLHAELVSLQEGPTTHASGMPNTYVVANNNHESVIGSAGRQSDSIRNSKRPPPTFPLQEITVPKCTILFIYGHNFVGDHSRPGLQNISSIGGANPTLNVCSRAVVATCSPNTVMNFIPLGANTVQSYLPEDGANRLPVPQMQNLYEDITAHVVPQAAAEIKKKCCTCRYVTFKALKVGDYATLDFPDRQF